MGEWRHCGYLRRFNPVYSIFDALIPSVYLVKSRAGNYPVKTFVKYFKLYVPYNKFVFGSRTIAVALLRAGRE